MQRIAYTFLVKGEASLLNEILTYIKVYICKIGMPPSQPFNDRERPYICSHSLTTRQAI